jgi:hypothetical protein
MTFTNVQTLTFIYADGSKCVKSVYASKHCRRIGLQRKYKPAAFSPPIGPLDRVIFSLAGRVVPPGEPGSSLVAQLVYTPAAHNSLASYVGIHANRHIPRLPW